MAKQRMAGQRIGGKACWKGYHAEGTKTGKNVYQNHNFAHEAKLMVAREESFITAIF